MARWVDACYGGRSKVVFGPNILESQRGVQQGDPLGPALFALAIHDAIVAAKEEVDAQMPGGLDWTAWYLDDGVIAGSWQAVDAFYRKITTSFASLGLEVNPGKSLLTLAAGRAGQLPEEAVPTVPRNYTRCTKLLGAPFGSSEFCEELTAKRVAQTDATLKAAANLSSTQAASIIVRHCGGFNKLAYSARVTPPTSIAGALRALDGAVKGTMEVILGEKIDARSWELATLSIRHGGIGLRSAARHGVAAYLASFAACADTAREIDPAFDHADLAGYSGIDAAKAMFDDAVAPDERLGAGSIPTSQRRLSEALDNRTRALLRAAEGDASHWSTHLGLVAVPGAGAWLTALPDEVGGDDEWEPELFRIALLRRLRMKVAQSDADCPCCGETFDSWGDHALVCPCRRDRVDRHNHLRDLVGQEAKDAGLGPELEKPGLLPERPREDGIGGEAPEDLGQGEAGGAAEEGDGLRRPADVWLPRGPGGESSARPQALDFAVTSGMRAGQGAATSRNPEAPLCDYAAHKRSYKETDSKCRAEGLTFTPVIFEAHGGGWGVEARRVLARIAAAQTSRGAWCAQGHSLRIAQRVSSSLHRDNARAVLLRLAGPVPSPRVAEMQTFLPLGELQ